MNINRIILGMTKHEQLAMVTTRFGNCIPAATNPLTKKSLRATGLIEPNGNLTELGLQVRTRLLAEGDTEIEAICDSGSHGSEGP